MSVYEALERWPSRPDPALTGVVFLPHFSGERFFIGGKKEGLFQEEALSNSI